MNTNKPDNETLYAPCPCGSGRKYKFCCFQRQRDAANQYIDLTLQIDPEHASALQLQRDIKRR